LLKSGSGRLKNIVLGHHIISWRAFEDAYNWDTEVNPIRIHYKLTETHIKPDKAEKMRNSLANEVLNKDMLNLMKVLFDFALKLYVLYY
jgi:hypothetical protein